jgi:D-alanine-D-alanine ligase
MKGTAAMTIVVLHDPPGMTPDPDRLDNLVQADQVSQVLEDLGHRVAAVAWSETTETLSRLINLAPDLVFNLVEAPWGQERLSHRPPELLAALGLPFTGADGRSMAVSSDKLAAKAALRAADLPTPGWIDDRCFVPPEPPASQYILKSVWEHGSRGLDEDSVVPADDPARLRARLRDRFRATGVTHFAEAYVSGREFNVSLLAGEAGPEVLPPAEIEFEGYGPDRPRVVGYRAKWIENSFEYRHTRRRFDFPEGDRELLETLTDLSLAAWRCFGFRGWARIDFRVDETGRPFILEANANPCLEAEAGFLAAAHRAGLSPARALSRIMADANRPGSGRRCRPGAWSIPAAVGTGPRPEERPITA